MCGISGAAGVEARERADVVARMTDRLAHRGPDSGGCFADAFAAIGVRRLRVIDLVTGDQPIANEDQQVWTVFNGEIYNFQALRRELEGRGHRLATGSDTEVVVHLYEDLGDSFVERIDGMFALAVWDARSRTLVLARDRLGEKPLLYRELDGEIAFASEHAALLEAIGPRPGVDETAIWQYLRLGYVPSPGDAFRGVRKLPPAHVLVWRDGRSVIRRYWSPPAPGSLRLSEPEAIEALRGTFEASVRDRLVADVPLGAFLSGGVDSSVLVATMAHLAPVVRTFSIGFDEAGFSELVHARRVAERYGTEHHELIVRPLQLDVLPTLARHYGEPFADSSALPTYYLSRMTRDSVTVALSGDGGDELFAGYDRYRAARLAGALDSIPALVRRPVFAAAAARLPLSGHDPFGPWARLRRFAAAAGDRPSTRYMRWQSIFGSVELDALLAPGFAEHARAGEALVAPDVDRFVTDPVAAAQEIDLGRYLPDDLLVKVDIASMAVSLEVRAPFLDTALVELAVGLPTSLKLRGRTGKYLLRRAFSDRVPVENLARRKHGFAVPLGAWFRGELGGFARDVLLSGTARGRGYLRADTVIRLLDEHASGRAEHGARLWALVMLELWHRELVDA